MGSTFDDDLALEPVDDGRFRALLSDRWNLRPLPRGGIVTAIGLRAMAAVLGDPGQRLRTSHTTFVAQVADGPLEVTVEVLRRGRSMSQLLAEVRNAGAERGHVTTAVFGATRPGFDLVDLAPPADLPAPETCVSFREQRDTNFWSQALDGRSAFGHAPWELHEPGPAERAMWFRFDEPAPGGRDELDPLALVVMADMMPGAVAEGLGGIERPWFGPSADLTFHLLDRCGTGWVLGHNRARFAGDGYASTDMALWDYSTPEVPHLVAYATQVLFFTFLD